MLWMDYGLLIIFKLLFRRIQLIIFILPQRGGKSTVIRLLNIQQLRLATENENNVINNNIIFYL